MMRTRTEKSIGLWESMPVSPPRSRLTFRSPQKTRRGSLILEVVVAAALLATLLAIISQAIASMHQQTGRIDRRVTAQQAVENLLEEFTARPWEALNTTSLEKLKLPAGAAQSLPEARISGSVAEETEPVPAKRITLELSWEENSSQRQRIVRLTTWVCRRVEDRP